MLDYLSDIEECSDEPQTEKFFRKHAIASTLKCLPPSYRDSAKAANVKLKKYYQCSDLLDYFYSTNVLDPRHRRSLIDCHMTHRDASKILNMCHSKVKLIDQIISSSEKANITDLVKETTREKSQQNHTDKSS